MTSSTHSIRQAEPRDVRAVAELWRELTEFHAAMDPHFTPADEGVEAFETFATEQIQSERAVVWVAEDAGVIVGYSLARIAERPACFPNRMFGQILDLAVTARVRRHGTGRALVDATERWFHEREISRIELNVVLVNEPARAFWDRMGYRPFTETRFRQF